MTKTSYKNIYDYIDQIRARPGMFSPGNSLFDIETLLYGYIACLQAHDIEEEVTGCTFHPREFSSWLNDEFGWTGNRGFAHSITENVEAKEQAFDRFFNLLGRFRNRTIR